MEHALSISMSNDCSEDTEKEITFNFYFCTNAVMHWAITSWNKSFKKQF